MSSRPFPFPGVSKEDPSFDAFMADLLTSCVDLRRSVAELQLVEVPSTRTSTGNPGMVAYDSNYWYICTAADTWGRIALDTSW